MSRLKHVHLSFRQILLECLCAGRNKKFVVAAPHREQGDLALTEILMEFWVHLHVVSIIVEQIQLNLAVTGAVEERLIKCVCFGLDDGGIGHAVCILPFCGGEGNEALDVCTVFVSACRPVLLDGSPRCSKAVGVGIAVLRDDCCDGGWVFEGEAETCWGAVVEDIDGIFRGVVGEFFEPG